MPIEPLESRRLMAAHTVLPGMDPTFAGDGRFDFREDFAPDGPLLSVGNAIFVPGQFGGYGYSGTPAVCKVRGDGTPDPRFGDKGYATLPFESVDLPDDYDEPSDHQASFRIDGAAYDAANRFLYLSSVRHDHYGDGNYVSVTRLRHDGRVDRTYGRRGTFTYVAPSSDADPTHASVAVRAMNPLPDGSMVLAVDRHAFAVAGGTDQNLALIKLRPNGTRDIHYGRRGFRQMFSGYVGELVRDPSDTEDVTYMRYVRRAYFSDVRTDANGVTSVLMKYERGYDGDEFGEPSVDNDITHGVYVIKAQTVSAAGGVDEATAQSWRLLDTTGGTDSGHAIPFATPDGRQIRVLVTQADDTDVHDAMLYTLRTGQRPRKQPLVVPELRYERSVETMIRAGNGQYFAFTDESVGRFNADLTRDYTFANKGIAGPSETAIFIDVGPFDGPYSTSGVTADDEGRFFGLDSDGGLDCFA